MTHAPINYYRKVHRLDRLESAWRQVHENGMQSTSLETKGEIEEWAKRARGRLAKLQRSLREGSFSFLPQIGVTPKKRSGKGHRPIVLAPIESRIVQRAILEVLQRQPRLKRLSEARGSFGGIKERGVTDAIAAVVAAVNRGARYYLRSDIKDFFTDIPRERVITMVAGAIPDERFVSLLEKATTTELANLTALRGLADLFPTHELGVAQGCALSPFFGNLLLSDFDRRLNGRGITCLRYIDDFLILGPKPRKVMAAFESGQRILRDLSMEAYDPRDGTGKSQMGSVEEGLTFLGCELRPGLIRPTKASRKRLLGTVRDRLKESTEAMVDPLQCYRSRDSAASTLLDIGNVLRSWGNQYKFCNDRNLMAHLDQQVSAMVIDYLRSLRQRVRGASADKGHEIWRRLLGVHLLLDSRSEPIRPFEP